jgi:[ribosomal protein S18]-alanine N-acetyltransferase
MVKGTDEKIRGPVNRLNIAGEEVFLTPMKLAEIEEVSILEKEAFSLPWSKDDFREIVLSQLYKGLILKGPLKQIMGYIVYYLAGDEGHVMNVVTSAKYRQMGVAQAMLDHVHNVFAAQGAKFSFLELRRSNYSAYRLYKKKGYVYVGLRKHYYADNMEDAILMRKVLD